MNFEVGDQEFESRAAVIKISTSARSLTKPNDYFALSDG